jgi:hypothetical protein
MIDTTLLVAWRSWHDRSESTHDKPLRSTESSKRFVCSYWKILKNRHDPREVILKGKQLAVDSASVHAPARNPKSPGKVWTKPHAGWVNLSVDGSYKSEIGMDGCCMILRGTPRHKLFSRLVGFSQLYRSS